MVGWRNSEKSASGKGCEASSKAGRVYGKGLGDAIVVLLAPKWWSQGESNPTPELSESGYCLDLAPCHSAQTECSQPQLTAPFWGLYTRSNCRGPDIYLGRRIPPSKAVFFCPNSEGAFHTPMERPIFSSGSRKHQLQKSDFPLRSISHLLRQISLDERKLYSPVPS